MGQYDHFRYRKGKDDDILEAVKKDVIQNKVDFADIARNALRQYYGLGSFGLPAESKKQIVITEQSGSVNIMQTETRSFAMEQEQRPKNNMLGGGLKGIVLQRKNTDITQTEGDELEERLSGLLTED